MSVIFPTTVDSVEDWLTQINLAKYVPSFASAGILQVAELPMLSDERLKQAGVTMVGHRKRLMQAAKELNIPGAGGGSVFPVASAMAQEAPASSGGAEPMDMEGPAPPQAAQRFNSTSSIFINSTITRPDIDEVIFCVAVVIHDRIVQGVPPPRSCCRCACPLPTAHLDGGAASHCHHPHPNPNPTQASR